MNRHGFLGCVSLVVLLLTVLSPDSVRASGGGCFLCGATDGEDDGGMFVALGLGLSAASLITVVPNSLDLAQRESPSLGWVIPGYIVGGLACWLGGIGLSNEGDDNRVAAVALTSGLAAIGVGVAAQVMAQDPPPEAARDVGWSVSPMVVRAESQTWAGLHLQVVGF